MFRNTSLFSFTDASVVHGQTATSFSSVLRSRLRHLIEILKRDFRVWFFEKNFWLQTLIKHEFTQDLPSLSRFLITSSVQFDIDTGRRTDKGLWETWHRWHYCTVFVALAEFWCGAKLLNKIAEFSYTLESFYGENWWFILFALLHFLLKSSLFTSQTHSIHSQMGIRIKT